ncbi:secreted protein [Candidatus Thiomargarita nelsonii]|uniref:Secreted protein n=1 Tax=Candidatus Thiomargarita nelsonii TaxID=1003181 RepID=A0A0A6RIU6_9GAMM|nr:secreted protein [Candidatus Thiomargarita nelsonii]
MNKYSMTMKLITMLFVVGLSGCVSTMARVNQTIDAIEQGVKQAQQVTKSVEQVNQQVKQVKGTVNR